MNATNIIDRAVSATQQSHEFVFKTKKVQTTHPVQFTLDYGFDPGPWAIVGINDTQFCFGYLPRQ